MTIEEAKAEGRRRFGPTADVVEWAAWALDLPGNPNAVVGFEIVRNCDSPFGTAAIRVGFGRTLEAAFADADRRAKGKP